MVKLKTDQEPTITSQPFGGDDMTVMDHPAFGQIEVTRVQGQRTLYGTDFIHANFVRITIKRSQLNRSLSRDWYYDKGDIVTVDLSEAQWATFVSAFGIGGGVPCTIAREGLKGVPTIPYRDEGQEFKVEADKALTECVEELASLKAMIEENTAGLSKSKQAAILTQLWQAQRKLKDNLPFVADSMAEHMEKRVEKTKIEVNAYATTTLMRLGIDALNEQRRAIGAQEIVVPISIEDKSGG